MRSPAGSDPIGAFRFSGMFCRDAAGRDATGRATGRRHTGEEMTMPEEEKKKQTEDEKAAEEDEKAAEEDKEKEPDKPPPGHVPIRALQDERIKRQTLEGQLVEQGKQIAELQGQLKGQTAERRPPQITDDDVLKAYQAGQISEMEKDRALFALAKKQAVEEAKREVTESLRAERTTQTARQEIQGYMQAVPGLTDRSSQEFRELTEEYQRLLDMGYLDSDATQRVACRSTFGPLERLQGRAKVDRDTRPERETFTEHGADRRPADASKDPLKNIPKVQIDFWQRMGYTREQMIAEAPYYREHRRGGRA